MSFDLDSQNGDNLLRSGRAIYNLQKASQIIRNMLQYGVKSFFEQNLVKSNFEYFKIFHLKKKFRIKLILSYHFIQKSHGKLMIF